MGSGYFFWGSKQVRKFDWSDNWEKNLCAGKCKKIQFIATVYSIHNKYTGNLFTYFTLQIFLLHVFVCSEFSYKCKITSLTIIQYGCYM